VPKNVYDVALWRYWNANDLRTMGPFPVTALMVAESPLLAALALMEQLNIKQVKHLCVGWQGCSHDHIWRNNNRPLSLYSDEQAPAGTEYEEATNA